MPVKQGWDLLVLWSLATLLIVAQVAVLYFAWGKPETTGLVIGGFNTVLPIVINSIRNIRQSQAMQSMVDALGNSAPVTDKES